MRYKIIFPPSFFILFDFFEGCFFRLFNLILIYGKAPGGIDSNATPFG